MYHLTQKLSASICNALLVGACSLGFAVTANAAPATTNNR